MRVPAACHDTPVEPVGRLAEVFPSIQGEGLQVGAMQVFVRFAGCSLTCRPCDTAHLRTAKPSFPVHPWRPAAVDRPIKHSLSPSTSHQSLNRSIAQSLNFFRNPVTVDRLIEILGEAYPLADFHSVSMTGGEPLEQAAFLLSLAKRMHEAGVPVFIETNGTLPEPVPSLIPWVSYWSVDLKLSKNWGLAGRGMMAKHRRFVAPLPPDKTFLKLVIDVDDDPDAILRRVSHGAFRPFPLVIQPLSTSSCPGSSLAGWDTSTIMGWIRALRPYFLEVRWVPQVHKLLRIP